MIDIIYIIVRFIICIFSVVAIWFVVAYFIAIGDILLEIVKQLERIANVLNRKKDFK